MSELDRLVNTIDFEESWLHGFVLDRHDTVNIEIELVLANIKSNRVLSQVLGWSEDDLSRHDSWDRFLRDVKSVFVGGCLRLSLQKLLHCSYSRLNIYQSPMHSAYSVLRGQHICEDGPRTILSLDISDNSPLIDDCGCTIDGFRELSIRLDGGEFKAVFGDLHTNLPVKWR